MNVFIVEDEAPAIEKLKSFIEYYDSEINILDTKTTVESTITWLKENPDSADLIFMDIQLPDGISFDIFSHVKINTPIIFTTAYDQYAIQAFKVNSIDYLLKPFDYDSFYKSVEKYKSFKANIVQQKERIKYEELTELVSQLKKSYKTRFLIKVGSHIKSLTTDKIAMFYAEGRNVSVVTMQGREYVIDHKLEELESMLDPAMFFRINRSFIININAISDVVVFSSSRLKVLLEKESSKELIVSREKVNEFKFWFSGE